MLRLRIPMERQSRQRPLRRHLRPPVWHLQPPWVLFTVTAHSLPSHFCATRECQALSSRSVFCWRGSGRPGGGKSKSLGERKDPECQAPHPVLSLLCLVRPTFLIPLGRLGDSNQMQGLDQVVSGVHA